jgi:SAM-dependent methyltransferase
LCIQADGYHLIEPETAAQRADTLHFAPTIDLVGAVAAANGRVSILDIGCGGGQYASMLDAAGVMHTYVGTDLDLALLTRARSFYGRGTRIVADAYNQPFSKRSFDVVAAFGIAFLLQDMFSFVAEVLRLAKHLAMVNVNVPPLGVTSLRTHSEGNTYHWMVTLDYCREELARRSLPLPDMALGWETPVDPGQPIPSFRAPESRYQVTLVWKKTSLQGQRS